MPDLVQPITVSIVLTIQMLVLGYAINQPLGVWDDLPEPAQNIWLKIFFSLSVGFGLDTTALFLLGLAGWLNGVGSISTLASITLLAASQLKPQPIVRPRLPQLLSIAAVLLLFVAITMFAIHVPAGSDDTMYQLPLARHYVEQQQITLQPYLRFPLFPQNMNLLLALGLMTGGPQFGAVIVAQFLANVPIFISSVGLIGALRWTTGATWPGFFASVLLLRLAPVREWLGYAFIDDGLLLYCWATLLATALSIAYGKGGLRCPWLLMAGFLAGMAMGTKYFGVILVSIPALWLLTVRRDWRATVVYGGTALIFGSWWYIRAWLVSGDPIHPFGGNIFGYFLWDAQDLVGELKAQAIYGVTKSSSHLWSSITTAGVRPFALVPLSLIYWRRLDSGLALILAASLCYFGFWFYTAQTNRYLAPIAAPAVFLSVWSLWQISQTLTRNISILSAVKISHSKTAGAFLCIAALVFPAKNALEQSRYQLQHWNEILQKRAGYILMQEANQLIPAYGNRLLNVGFEGAVFFYNGRAIGDWWGLGRYRQMMQCSDVCRLVPPEIMQDVMARHHARMLVVNRKRFEVDLPAYQRHFTLQKLTADGALFTVQ